MKKYVQTRSWRMAAGCASGGKMSGYSESEKVADSAVAHGSQLVRITCKV